MQREVALKCTSRAGIRWGGERDERLPLARLAFVKAHVSGRPMRDRALAIVRTPAAVLPIVLPRKKHRGGERVRLKASPV